METTTTVQCEQCQDSGWVPVTKDGTAGVARCPHVVARLAAKRTLRAIGNEYAAQAKIAELPPFAREKAQAFVAGWASGQGMVILGDVGVGKSWMASAIANALLETQIKSMTFATVSEMLLEVRAGIERSKAAETGQAVEFPDDEILRETDLLILDDMGAEKASEWTEMFLYGIVLHRYGRRAPLIVTSNRSPEMLEEHIGVRTWDRLMGFCQGKPIALTGASRRWKRAGKP